MKTEEEEEDGIRFDDGILPTTGAFFLLFL